MEFDDLITILDENEIVYEDEYRKVIKILHEMPSYKEKVKRIQLVIWKSKKTDIPDIDIRIYDKEVGKYSKGISLNFNEAKQLHRILLEYFNEYD